MSKARPIRGTFSCGDFDSFLFSLAFMPNEIAVGHYKSSRHTARLERRVKKCKNKTERKTGVLYNSETWLTEHRLVCWSTFVPFTSSCSKVLQQENYLLQPTWSTTILGTRAGKPKGRACRNCQPEHGFKLKPTFKHGFNGMNWRQDGQGQYQKYD